MGLRLIYQAKSSIDPAIENWDNVDNGIDI